MKAKKDTISARQLLFIFTIMVSSPATRFFPSFASLRAKQAGWVSPLISAAPFILLIIIMNVMFKSYKKESMAEIIDDIMGKLAGKFIVMLYLLWVTWNVALYLRYSVERLVSSVYAGFDIKVFVIINLIFIVYIIHSDLSVIGRMGEIILPFIGFMLLILAICLLPLVRLDNVAPVYFNDIVPIMKASVGVTSILAYVFLLSFLSDRVSDKKHFLKLGFTTAFVNVSSVLVVLFITIGVLGSSTAERAPVPVLVAVKQVNIADTIENIEAIVVAIWIFADFILVSALIITALNIMKKLFKLSDTKGLIKIFAVFAYYLTLSIAANKLELEDFSNKLLEPINMSFGYAIPFLLFAVGKLRKKL